MNKNPDKLLKINSVINIVIGSFIGVFIGSSAYTYREHLKYQQLQMVNSAPWYTSIIVRGIFVVAVMVVAVVLKLLIKKKLKKINR